MTVTAEKARLATSPEVLEALVDAVSPNPWNRKKFDPAKLDELAKSIEKVGILQAIVTRPDPKDDALFQIVAGERRWRAAKKAKLAVVPITVRELTDLEVVELMAIENTQREDVDPLVEGEHYAFLIKNGRDVATIAGKLGKSPSYVYGRLKLADLIPEAKQALAGGALTAGHAILIARIPQPKDQKTALGGIREWHNGPPRSVREFATWIERELHLDLANAPFDTLDAKLLPRVGACSTCTKRSGFSPDLFPEMGKRDLCMDRACHDLKVEEHMVGVRKQLAASGELVRISRDWSRDNKGILTPDRFTDAKKGDRGAVAAVVESGPDKGKVVHVRVKDTPKPAKAPAGDPVVQKTGLDAIPGGERGALFEEAITARLKEFQEAVRKIAAKINLPDEFTWNLVQCELYFPRWSAPGKSSSGRALGSLYADQLQHVILPTLPGKVAFAGHTWEAKNALGAKSFLAYLIWEARDTAPLDKGLEKDVLKRWKAIQSQTSAKSGKTPKAKTK